MKRTTLYNTIISKRHKLVYRVICIMFSLVLSTIVQAQYAEKIKSIYTIIAEHTNVKTNALYDFSLIVPHYGWAPTPNIAIEYLPKKGHWTGVFDFYIANWRNDRKNKTWIVRNFSLEGRYYIHKKLFSKQGTIAPYTGHYFSSCTNFFKYDIQLDANKGYLSRKLPKNFGINLGYGYVYRIKESRFKVEGSIQIGFIHSRYDTYHAAEPWAQPGEYYYDWHLNPRDYHKYLKKVNYFGPTRIGISVSYDLH